MPRTIHETVLTDRDGAEHRYECVPHTFDEAVKLKLQLLQIIVRPLGEALGELIGEASDETYDLSTDNIDWSKLGPLLETIPTKLLEAGGSDLFEDVLKYTNRITPNGNPDGKPRRLRLREPLARDEAFAGGNWGECYRALLWVLGVNFAPFSMDASDGWAGYWAKLRELLPVANPED